MERFLELSQETPLLEDVLSQYEWSNERLRDINYRADMELQRLKGCV
jgi:hypothetical protein